MMMFLSFFFLRLNENSLYLKQVNPRNGRKAPMAAGTAKGIDIFLIKQLNNNRIMKHQMPQLPYAPNALEPKMSEETINLHYGKHLQTYVDNLNKLSAGTMYEDMDLEEIICKATGPVFNNAAQVWNHTFFFENLTPAPQCIGFPGCRSYCADNLCLSHINCFLSSSKMTEWPVNAKNFIKSPLVRDTVAVFLLG